MAALRCRLFAFLALLLQLLCLVISRQRVDNRLQLAVHDEIELVQSQADAMIRDAVLWEIVGPDLFTAVPAAYLAAPFRTQRGLLLLQLHLVQPRAKHALGLGAILDLALLVLAGN